MGNLPSTTLRTVSEVIPLRPRTSRLPRTARRLTIHGNVLGGIYPRQVNQVNVTSGAVTRTFAMTPGDSRTVTLPRLAPAPRGTTSPRQGNRQPR